MNTALSRRTFVQSACAATLAAALPAVPAKAAPNDRLRHAVIGLGGQGQQHAVIFNQQSDCDVVAICDVDPARRTQTLKRLDAGEKIAEFEDFRRLLDAGGFDTVSIVTPDHWHTPMALAALQLGKDVYVEKPCSHNVIEGKLLAQAAARSGKCVQHGTQGRSAPGIRAAFDWMQAGGLGRIRVAKAINHQFRPPIGRAPVSDPPPGVNYDLWTGPAPLKPFTENRWHYNWHWLWDFGTGDIGNDGVHQIDQARWGLGAGMPKAVSASGGQLFYDDDHETPDTQMVTFEYDHAYLLYEMRLYTDYPLEGHTNGVVFYGDEGRLDIHRDGCTATFKNGETRQFEGGPDLPGHMRNFLECVRNGKPDELKAPISEGAISAALSHLGNIATRVGRRLHFDADKWECSGDPEATALLTRSYREGYELPSLA